MIARVIAVVADATQFGLLPLFAEGGASVLNDVLDLVVGVTLSALLGWHWAFLPAFLAELVPVVDLVPTWTIAVLIVTRGGPAAGGASAPILASRSRPGGSRA